MIGKLRGRHGLLSNKSKTVPATSTITTTTNTTATAALEIVTKWIIKPFTWTQYLAIQVSMSSRFELQDRLRVDLIGHATKAEEMNPRFIPATMGPSVLQIVMKSLS